MKAREIIKYLKHVDGDTDLIVFTREKAEALWWLASKYASIRNYIIKLDDETMQHIKSALK